jgi:cytochrome c oxidase subunit III
MSAKLDVRHLRDYDLDHGMPIWLGTLSFMIIEGSAFAMAIAAYLYLQSQNPDWPLGPVLPEPLLGGILALFLLASEIPNQWIKKRIRAFDLKNVRRGLLLMSAVGLGALAFRAFEFGFLNIRWDTNAFGSIVWALIFLHTTHVVIDVVETWVMTVMAFVGPVDGRRLGDFLENAEYWDFVVLTWLPVYFFIYWAPRWFAH